MELYIIRHGQSANNTLEDVRNRVCDPPLTEMGRLQVARLAEYVASAVNRDGSRCFPITHLYCSPMWRALETAQPVGRALGIAPEVWIDLHEHGGIYLDHGENGGIIGYPGKSRSEILAEFPDYVLPVAITERGWWTDGFEDVSLCNARAMRVARRLRSRAASDDHIALITHGDFSDALLKALFEQLPAQRHFFYHRNTGISQITWSAEGLLTVRYLNRIDHLPIDLVSASAQ